MTRILLAIFLILFSYKIIAVDHIVYEFADSHLFSISEDIQSEADEQNKSKQAGEEEDLYYLTRLLSPTFILFLLLQIPSAKYCKPFSGFISHLFSPPDVM